MVQASHVHADNSTYIIVLHASDEDAGVASRTATAIIANVASIISATDQTAVQKTPFTMQVAGFTDPGFTTAAAGTQETFTATIN